MARLNSLEKGDPSRPAVLVLHGLLGSARNLFRLVDALASAGYYALAYDQRGHGHSDRAETYSLGLLAADVFDFLDLKGLARAHLVGHSMGARVSLAAAAKRPSRVKSLTMLDSGISVREGHLNNIKGIVDSLPPELSSRAEAERIFAHHSPELRQWLISNLRAESQPPYRLKWVFDLEGIRRDLLVAMTTIDQTDDFRKATCPVLVARGERTESLAPEDFDRMQALNARARFAVIENAGHWVHADNFERTRDLVIEFINSVENT